MDYQPDEQEQQVLDVLREHHRANPMLIREETDLRKEYVSRALSGLQKAGVARKVTRGLYEHVPSEDDNYERDTITLDPEPLERALDDIETAAERGDPQALQDALEDAREELQNAE